MEYREIEIGCRRSEDGTLSVYIVIEPDGSVRLDYCGQWPCIPNDSCDGFTRWLRLPPNEGRKLYSILTGRIEPSSPADLAELLMSTYERNLLDAYEDVAALCKRYGFGEDQGTWWESAFTL